MIEPARAARRARHEAIRAQIADEEIKTAEAEAAEDTPTRDVKTTVEGRQEGSAERTRTAEPRH
jgi:hypothetical protein